MYTKLIASLRYQTIDSCLRNTARRYTLQNLQMECAKALKAKFNSTNIPTIQTILDDINKMKNGSLGYHAPIKNKVVRRNKQFYVYSNPSFSINHSRTDSRVILSFTPYSESSPSIDLSPPSIPPQPSSGRNNFRQLEQNIHLPSNMEEDFFNRIQGKFNNKKRREEE